MHVDRSKNLALQIVAGRRSYRQRMARQLHAHMLQAVDVELFEFAANSMARLVQRPLDSHRLFEYAEQIGSAHSWRSICDKLGLLLSAQLVNYFKRPVCAIIVKQPSFSAETTAMMRSLHDERCVTRSASILAEHLLSNVWSSFSVPGIGSFGNELLSEVVDAGGTMLDQFELGPQQLRRKELFRLHKSLTGRLTTGILQIRSNIALTLYQAIKELNQVTFLAKYDRMLDRQVDSRASSTLYLAAD